MEMALTLSEDANNPVVGDLRLVGGTLLFTHTLAEEVAQRLLIRLKFFKGEWYLNLVAGTPYLTAVFEKGVPESAIRSVFTSVVGGCKGVAAVDSLETSINPETRTLDLRFRARLEDGSTFVSTSYGPFVVALG